jgi:hypothetical protein
MLGRRVTRRTLFVAKDRLLKSWLELQNRYHAAHTRRVSAALLRRLQAKLPRNSNQIARQRIRRFESYMPSQAVGLQQPNAGQFRPDKSDDDASAALGKLQWPGLRRSVWTKD